MPIPLTQQSRPNAKMPYPGMGVEMALIGTRRRPWMEFGTQTAKIGKDGQPRQQLVVTGIVTNANAVCGPQGQERPVQPGEVVDVYLHGHAWGSWIEAERAHSGLQVGDIVRIVYTHDEPSSQPGANPRKVRQIAFRRAEQHEAGLVAQAEAAYYSLGFDKPDEYANRAPDTADDGPFGAQGSQQPPQQQAWGGGSGGFAPQQPAQAPQQPTYAPQGQWGGVQQPQPAPAQQTQPQGPQPAPWGQQQPTTPGF